MKKHWIYNAILNLDPIVDPSESREALVWFDYRVMSNMRVFVWKVLAVCLE